MATTDYSKKKNAELEELLKARGLSHTGKKADLVARLQQHDKQSSGSSSTAPTTTTKVAENADDEIDWDLDTKTEKDTKIAPTTTTTTTNTEANKDSNGTTKESPSEAAPTTSVDFTSGISQTTLDDEIAKRQKRAARFGIQPDSESNNTAEAHQKALDRAKRFGIEVGQAVKGLDQALPERAPKLKRGHGRGDHKREEGAKRSRVQENGGGGGDNGKERKVGSGGAWMSEGDKIAAEARKKRFG